MLKITISGKPGDGVPTVTNFIWGMLLELGMQVESNEHADRLLLEVEPDTMTRRLLTLHQRSVVIEAIQLNREAKTNEEGRDEQGT